MGAAESIADYPDSPGGPVRPALSLDQRLVQMIFSQFSPTIIEQDPIAELVRLLEVLKYHDATLLAEVPLEQTALAFVDNLQKLCPKLNFVAGAALIFQEGSHIDQSFTTQTAVSSNEALVKFLFKLCDLEPRSVSAQYFVAKYMVASAMYAAVPRSPLEILESFSFPNHNSYLLDFGHTMRFVFGFAELALVNYWQFDLHQHYPGGLEAKFERAFKVIMARCLTAEARSKAVEKGLLLAGDSASDLIPNETISFDHFCDGLSEIISVLFADEIQSLKPPPLPKADFNRYVFEYFCNII